MIDGHANRSPLRYPLSASSTRSGRHGLEAAAAAIAEAGLALVDLRRLTIPSVDADQRDRLVRKRLGEVLHGASAQPDSNIYRTCAAPHGLHYSPPHQRR